MGDRPTDSHDTRTRAPRAAGDGRNARGSRATRPVPRTGFEEALRRSSHEGSWWQHRPSVVQVLAACYVSALPIILVVSPLTAGIEGALGVIVRFAAAAGTFWLSLQVTELVYHRVLGR